MLTDAHNRIINYIRLAVTDRCNLRCTYCMPEQMQFLQRKELLTNEEILTLLKPLAAAGINKLRITGGEPFLRKDLMPLLAALKEFIPDISITTNGVLTQSFIPQLKALGIQKINLSLDTLHRDRFLEITRRDQFPAVMQTLHSLLEHDMQVKLNVVIMAGVNTDELPAFAALTKHTPISVRFIEEMPFNGQGHSFSGNQWNYLRILDTLQEFFPLEKLPDAPQATSITYQIPGHQGQVGVIPAYSRTFCGTCNRLRITPTGGLKTCLYGGDVLNVRDLLRNGANNAFIMNEIRHALGNRAIDGFAAERQNQHWDSMSVIGG
ncbi:GTP 3',8-cyclase MoaA [Chitinophaga sancti]|uniref:GTP 3',8-cyclase n=1 Tax=Chitinophaga sancti TaxID=1004 RepID=A0A1K1SEU5_9BACT|nr:GTP 3',8-cyclase MoaA [Chitinophaga sancti]WQD59981.1 GTP 3',8-cyclase MoaA [Chitinophaga sancti]WQG87889.1 GTP 3',8-cyclase MoaA [Chitinophaga sancti]SFW82599.1 cyclic pyranopterin phosphate synthase [Chitinophaga sancti]